MCLDHCTTMSWPLLEAFLVEVADGIACGPMGTSLHAVARGAREAQGVDLRERPLRDRHLLVVVVVVTLPILWMGYGTDIDVANLLGAAETLRSGSYEPSRTPGAPVFEVLVTLLDGWGGFLAVNLATAGAAAGLVVGIARLVRAWGHANGDLVALAFFVSPVTIIASTSLADFVWALAFFVGGALVHLGGVSESGVDAPPRSGLGGVANRPWMGVTATGVLFALAIGTRASTAFVILAFLVADGWSPSRRMPSVRAGLVAFPLGALLFVPSWLAFDRTMEFLENEDGYRGFLSNLGLFLYKNYVAAGPVLAVVVLVVTPTLLRALPAWRRDPMLRFAILGLLVTEGLFFQLPWKLAHLLPSLLALVLWVGASALGDRRRFLWVLVAAVAVNGIVTFRPLAPDEPGEATTGTWNPAFTAGLLVNDIDCRSESMRRAPSEANVERAWDCTLRPLRGPVEADEQ